MGEGVVIGGSVGSAPVGVGGGVAALVGNGVAAGTTGCVGDAVAAPVLAGDA
ncbi:MAG TPA: hypothetical protein VGR87_05170 [Candidatus Limnocylindria bacterium]|jgi:hypothetical protein|nr:hypothetical protein [Candidatus Limnocylindria bacterium]